MAVWLIRAGSIGEFEQKFITSQEIFFLVIQNALHDGRQGVLPFFDVLNE